jgi:chromate reductase
MKVLGISGSLRGASYSTALLRALAELVPEGMELELWDGLRELPPFDEDAEADPGAAVDGLRAAIAGVDAVLIVTPEYNASVPGVLKNALDWASRPSAASPLRNKPVAIVAASPGAFGGVWAQADARRILARIGARVVGPELAIALVHTRIGEDGVPDQELTNELGVVFDALAEAVEARELVAA